MKIASQWKSFLWEFYVILGKTLCCFLVLPLTIFTSMEIPHHLQKVYIASENGKVSESFSIMMAVLSVLRKYKAHGKSFCALTQVIHTERTTMLAACFKHTNIFNLFDAFSAFSVTGMQWMVKAG